MSCTQRGATTDGRRRRAYVRVPHHTHRVVTNPRCFEVERLPLRRLTDIQRDRMRVVTDELVRRRAGLAAIGVDVMA